MEVVAEKLKEEGLNLGKFISRLENIITLSKKEKNGI